jgi:hypothetical protein
VLLASTGECIGGRIGVTITTISITKCSVRQCGEADLARTGSVGAAGLPLAAVGVDSTTARLISTIPTVEIGPMSPIGTERTSGRRQFMTVFGGEAEVTRADGDFRF